MKFPTYKRSALAVSLLCLSAISWADVDKAWDAFDSADLVTSFAEFKISAENNEKDAAFIYGSLLLNPSFPEYDQTEGREWLKKAADAGDAKAAYNLAYSLFKSLSNSSWDSDIVKSPATVEEFQKYVQMALDANLPEAYEFTINNGMSSQELFGIEDPKELVALITKVHEIQPTAMTNYYVGVMALQGHTMFDDIPYEPQKAAQYLEAAYQSGAKSSVHLLKALYSGDYEGFPADKAKYNEYAKIYYENFSEINDPVYFHVRDISPLNTRTQKVADDVVAKFKKASETNANAARMMGALSQDPKVAKEYFQKAVDLGDKSAAIAMYYLDEGWYADKTEVIEQIAQLAKSGDMQANLFLSQNLTGSDAIPYLTKAAESGDFVSMVNLARYHGDNALYSKTSLKEALDWYNKLIEQFPNDATAYREKAWLLYNDLGIRSEVMPAIFADLNHAIELNPQDSKALMHLAQIYQIDAQYGDAATALVLYQQIISLNNDDLEADQARLFQAMMLKYGEGNVAKDEKTANVLFSEIIEKYPEDYQALYELADSYHHGKGVEKDLNKAIELYRLTTNMNAHVPLGMLLVQSDDAVLQAEGLDLIISVAESQKVDAETLALLLSFKDKSPIVQEWLYKLVTVEPYRANFDALAEIKKSCDAGNTLACVNYARWMLGKQINTDEAYQLLNASADKGNVNAVRALLDHAKEKYNYPAQRILTEKLVALEPNDDNYQQLAEFYFFQLDYDLADQTYQKIENPSERAEYDQERIPTEREYLEGLLTRAEQKDDEAVRTLFYMYQNNKRPDLAIEAIEKWGDLNNEETLNEWIYLLDQSADPEHISKATKQLAKNVLINQTTDFAILYQRYAEARDRNITRQQMLDWIAQYAVINAEDAKVYLNSMNGFDDILQKSHSSQKRVKRDALSELDYAYQMGIGTQRDSAKHFKILEQLVELKDESAAYQMAEAYRTGKDVPLNWDKAVHYYKLLPDEGYAYALENIDFYKDVVAPAQKGDMNATFKLGKYYLEDYAYSDQPKARAEGYQLVLKAAEKGVVDAQYFLSLSYNYVGLTNYQRNEWLQKAADNGHAEAQQMLAQHLEIETPLSEVQVKEVIRLYSAAAKTLPEAKLGLLRFYYSQNMVAEADKILPTLSEEERTYQYTNIARWYEYSNGALPRSNQKALEFYQKAYDKGDIKSGVNMVSLYLNDPIAPKKAEGMALFTEVLNQAMESESPYALDEVIAIVNSAIKGIDGFDKTLEMEQFGLEWAEKILSEGNVYAGATLSDYYKEKGDTAKEYFYLKLIESWALDELIEQLGAEEIEAQNKAVEAYKQQVSWPY
ncbi:SEL1-like repeat protein [Wohlfahrtiimonas populi]|uniref:SEL1-like repeat protein n=1 Tax=Wohlfahrtiimonas populi TaxID=1940240 RepID=UPI00098D223D|nr:SEL1-like repeat protein [Wohlfahrtiimonas populi]